MEDGGKKRERGKTGEEEKKLHAHGNGEK